MGKLLKWILLIIILGIIIYLVYQWLSPNSDTAAITDGTLIRRGWEWIEGKI